MKTCPFCAEQIQDAAIADDIAHALRGTDADAEQRRCDSLRQLDQRRRTVVSKLDRGYEDFVSGRISEEFWTRKSQEWEGELQTVDAERLRLEQARPLATTTAERILELAKKAGYKSQEPANSADCLEQCFRTARSIAELSGRLTVSHSTCSSAGTRQESGGVDGTRASQRREPLTA